MGLYTTDLLGPIPSPLSADILSYLENAAAARLARSPVERGRSIYVSSSLGNDANNGLSPAAPFATLARVAEYLDTISNDLAVLFKAADTWYATAGIDCAKPEITFSRYGDGPKPLLSTFTHAINGEFLIEVGDGTYTYSEELVPNMVWLYNAANPLRAYMRESSQAACAARAGSWFANGTTFWIRPFVGETFDDSTVIRFQAADNSDDGIKIVNGDRCRIDNLAGYGWGMNATAPGTQAMPFSLAMQGSNEAVVSYCDAFYSGTHLLAQYSPAGGGVCTFYRNRAGLAYPSAASGETIYNIYGTNTDGFDALGYQNRTAYGTLPHHSWVTAAVTKRGASFFGHHGTLATPRFAAVVDHITEANEWGAEIPAGIEGYQTSETNINAIRTFIVREVFELNDRAGLGLGRSDRGAVRINCRYDLRPRDDAAQCFALVASGGYRAWNLNVIYDVDMTNFTQTLAMVNSTSNANTEFGHWQGCHLNIRNTPFVWFVLSHDGFAANGGAPVEYAMFAFNSIFTRQDGTALLASGNGNNTNVLKNNALFGVHTGSGTGRKWDGDAAEVNLGAHIVPGAVPATTSPLYLAGTGTGTLALEYDFHGRRRNTATPTIGPIEPIKVASGVFLNEAGFKFGF